MVHAASLLNKIPISFSLAKLVPTLLVTSLYLFLCYQEAGHHISSMEELVYVKEDFAKSKMKRTIQIALHIHSIQGFLKYGKIHDKRLKALMKELLMKGGKGDSSSIITLAILNKNIHKLRGSDEPIYAYIDVLEKGLEYVSGIHEYIILNELKGTFKTLGRLDDADLYQSKIDYLKQDTSSNIYHFKGLGELSSLNVIKIYWLFINSRHN